MKKLVVFTVLVLSTLLALGQADSSRKAQKKIEQIQKKELAAGMYASEKSKLLQLAMDMNLVLEATAIYGRHGYNATVTQNNFILIDSTDFILQTSSPTYVGPNGMGGVTIRGVITSYEVKEGKEKHPVVITAQINTFGLGVATLIVRLPNAENSSAIFTTNSGGTITFSGPVTSVEESSVYKGMNLY